MIDEARDPVAPVRDYYDAFGEREWTRLDKADDGTVEFALHARAFTEFLPPPPAQVLDLGGGPGRWAFWLAERGYTVTLADLSPRLIQIARERMGAARTSVQANIVQTLTLDARDLSCFPDASFDAVLCLGPMYHLIEPSDRDRTAGEIFRVLRPRGRVFAAFMPPTIRLLSSVLERGSAAFADGTIERILKEGVYTDERPGRFTNGALLPPSAIAPLFACVGFTLLRLMASQGMLTFVQKELSELGERDPEALRLMLDLAYRTADDPAILGMAAHLLYIGEKPTN